MPDLHVINDGNTHVSDATTGLATDSGKEKGEDGASPEMKRIRNVYFTS